VPLGIAVLAIGTGAGWVTKINYEVLANSNKIREISVSQSEIINTLKSIDKKLTIIEFQMRGKNGNGKN
jgi:hypothetical protein